MKFFFPDSQDQIDPSFDVFTETRSPHRVRQRDDRYAHEVLDVPPYDGILISKSIVDGLPGGSGKYTIAQRNRLYRQGAHRFFRLDSSSTDYQVLGDCGAFTYATEETPVYSVDEVIDFYEGCGLDLGIAMDHLILCYDGSLDDEPTETPREWIERQELNFRLAEEFLHRWGQRNCSFQPIGVAHGWSPGSYTKAIEKLQKIGYSRVALGGMVPLRTPDVLDTLSAVSRVLESGTDLHLLGVVRTDHLREFVECGVTSFDCTSPFRQAFMDDRDNYYGSEGNYVAVRIPQVDGNTRLRKLVTAGEVDQRLARKHEEECLSALRSYGDHQATLEDVLNAVQTYNNLIGEKKNRTEAYTRTLESRPWERCGCVICKEIGIDVIIFRGAERNRRRGFHNLAVFESRLRNGLPAIAAS